MSISVFVCGGVGDVGGAGTKHEAELVVLA